MREIDAVFPAHLRTSSAVALDAGLETISALPERADLSRPDGGPNTILIRSDAARLRRCYRGAVALGPALALAGVLALAPAEQHIVWEASADCPSVAELEQTTKRYLGAEIHSYTRELEAFGRVEAVVGGLRLELSIRVDDDRERHELRGLDCEQLGRDAALLIASALDPFARGPQPQATPRKSFVSPPILRPRVRPRLESSGDTSAPEPMQPEPAPALEPGFGPLMATQTDNLRTERSPRGSSKQVAGFLAAAGVGFAGVFPDPGGGASVEGGLERGLLRWQAGAAGWFGGQFRPTPNLGANLRAWTGSTGVCVVPNSGRWSFPICATAGAGAISARAVGTGDSRQVTRPWVYAGAELRGRWTPAQRPISIYFGLAVLPNLVKPAWALSNPDATFRVPPVTGLLQVGVELRGLRVQTNSGA